MSWHGSWLPWTSAIPLAIGAVMGTTSASADALTGSGTAQWNVIQVVHPLAKLPFGPFGEGRFGEITGVVQDLSGEGPFHNMALNCLIHFQWIGEPRHTNGECVQTDADGDQIFMTFEASGPGVGDHTILGGSGKFKGITGTAAFKVGPLPGPREGIGMASVAYDVSWQRP
jgi:hypothetical protein